MPNQILKLPKYIKLDSQIRPQDDLYSHVCNHWIAKNPLTQNKKARSVIDNLRRQNEKKILNIFNEWLENKQKLTPEQKQAVIYYETLINRHKYQDTNLNSIKNIIKSISIKNKDFILEDFLGQAHSMGIGGFFSLGPKIDIKNNQRYCLCLGPGGLNLTRDDYLSNDPKKQSIRRAYLEYLKDFQKLCLKFDLNFNITPEKILEIQTHLAKIQWPLLKARDIQKTYNLYTWPEFCKKFKFNWELYFKKIQLKPPADIKVSQPSYLTDCLKYLNTLPQEDIQNYLIHKALRQKTWVIQKFAKLSFNFFSKTIYGIRRQPPMKKRAFGATHGTFYDLFGQIYVQKHFSKDYQKDIQRMTDEINQAFARRLQNNNWLGEQSKKIALKKLKNMIYIIGYSGYWYDHSRYKLKPNKLIENGLTLSSMYRKERYNLLTKKPNRQRFGSTVESAQEINAYAFPVMVAIRLPAGILQKPFYNHKADLFYNLGFIGRIIGHELTHHFDPKGSLYDENGNLNPWMTKKESENFKLAYQKLIKTANEHQITPDIKMNGQQVIGEAVADLGGLEIVLDVAKKYCKEQAFDQEEIKESLKHLFIAFAYVESSNRSIKFKERSATTMSHPDAIFRVNGIVSHCDDFYTVFDVKKGDKLYLAPKDRAKIW